MSRPRRQGGPSGDTAGRTARLVPLAGAPPGEVPLTGKSLLVGRDATCGLVCAHAGLSRQHARLERTRGTWRLEDLGSTNGTTLDGRPVTAAVPLAAGAVICFGGGPSWRFEPAPAAAGVARATPDLLLCLQLRPLAGGQPFVLRRAISTIGRDPQADLRLDLPQISGIHARVQRHAGRVLLRDTSSRNGTAVNGENVREARLRPGDHVAFGDIAFVVERSRVPTTQMVFGATAALLVVALAVVATVLLNLPQRDFEPLWTREMYVEQVTASLVAVVRAHDREPPAREVARAQLDIARRSLIAADLLRPDRQTPEEVLAAMEQAAQAPAVKRQLGGRPLRAVVEQIVQEPRTEPPAPPPVAMYDLRSELSALVAEFGIDTRDTPIPFSLVGEVERFARFWSGQQREFTLRSSQRGRPLLADLQRELRRNHLPEVFCYLPFIESGYQTNVVSTAGARGLWQLMPGTARDYGLQVGEVDERTDPLRATEAACRHLEMLMEVFGPESFMCVLAAYNKGHKGLSDCLRQTGDLQSPWRFWNLVNRNPGCLRQETIEYVPRFLAAVVVLRNPGQYGLAPDMAPLTAADIP